ncbi:MAG: TIGR01777 family oxidoreductase [Gallionellaceae bacterium]
MQILITGGTGLIGRHLCKALLAAGHLLTVLSRHPETVATKCGLGVKAIASLDEWLPSQHFDAVINLSGEPIADAHWSDIRKQILWDSRIGVTEKLVQRIAVAEHKPAVFLSGSAIGYYGNSGDAELNEDASVGGDFAAKLCIAWETAALSAEQYGVRVCLLRTGLVLAKEGGLLGKLLLLFKLAMGARLGNGKQWMSWVHIGDYVAMVLALLNHQELSGPFNLTAPHPATNKEFTQQLAHALHRPALFFAPAFLLKLAMGERASLLLEGQRVLPNKLELSGCKFSHPTLDGALKQLLN